MAALSPKDFATTVMPWRFSTPLHKDMQARVNRQIINLAANTPLNLTSLVYSTETIDRIIGVSYRNLSATTIGSMNALYGTQIATGNFLWFEDRRAKANYTVGANGRTFTWAFNVETLTDGIDLWLTSLLAHTAEISFYNFEIGASYVGN